MTYAVRSALVTLACTVLFPTAAAAQEITVPRHIDLRPHGSIVLGEPFTADAIAEPAPGGLRNLWPGTFAGADSIQVLLIGDRVAAIRFVYAPSKADFSTFIANGTGTFGVPGRWTEAGDAGARTEYALWEDGETSMELRLVVRDASIELTGMLSDPSLLGSAPQP